MSDGLDEIMSAVGGDIEEVNYVRSHISPELQAKFDDEQIQYFVDVIFEYIDSKDEDEEIVVDDVAQYVVAQAKKEEFGVFSRDDSSAVGDADLDFLEGVE